MVTRGRRNYAPKMRLRVWARELTSITAPTRHPIRQAISPFEHLNQKTSTLESLSINLTPCLCLVPHELTRNNCFGTWVYFGGLTVTNVDRCALCCRVCGPSPKLSSLKDLAFTVTLNLLPVFPPSTLFASRYFMIIGYLKCHTGVAKGRQYNEYLAAIWCQLPKSISYLEIFLFFIYFFFSPRAFIYRVRRDLFMHA